MARLWTLGGLSLKALARRVWHEILDDNVFGRAAELSFYFLLALLPLLVFLTSLLGFLSHSGELRDALLHYFQRVAPRSAYRLVVDALNQIAATAGHGKLSLGLIGTLWIASSGLAAITEGLNAAYDVPETRPWWKTRLLALLLTLTLGIFVLISLVLVLYGTKIGAVVAYHLGLATAFGVLWDLVHWPIALVIVLISVDLLYRFAPNLKGQKWAWTTPGSVVAVALWLAVSLGFRFYLRFFNTYSATYGSLGAVIILMLWFYLSGAAILIGAEVNSEIERAVAKR